MANKKLFNQGQRTIEFLEEGSDEVIAIAPKGTADVSKAVFDKLQDMYPGELLDLSKSNKESAEDTASAKAEAAEIIKAAHAEAAKIVADAQKSADDAELARMEAADKAAKAEAAKAGK